MKTGMNSPKQKIEEGGFKLLTGSTVGPDIQQVQLCLAEWC